MVRIGHENTQNVRRNRW